MDGLKKKSTSVTTTTPTRHSLFRHALVSSLPPSLTLTGVLSLSLSLLPQRDLSLLLSLSGSMHPPVSVIWWTRRNCHTLTHSIPPITHRLTLLSRNFPTRKLLPFVFLLLLSSSLLFLLSTLYFLLFLVIGWREICHGFCLLLWYRVLFQHLKLVKEILILFTSKKSSPFSFSKIASFNSRLFSALFISLEK